MNKEQTFILCNIGPQMLDDTDTRKMAESANKCHEDDERDVAWDDVTGVPLKPEMVREARRAEMEYFIES